MNTSALHIGEVARRSGVSIDTVRYYERRRLLPAAPRTEGGFRLFSEETVEQVQFIKQAQDLGFSLNEIGEILTTGGASECRRLRDHLKVKLTELDERIQLMQDFRKTFTRYLAACERELSRHADQAVCPVFAKISRGNSPNKKKKVVMKK